MLNEKLRKLHAQREAFEKLLSQLKSLDLKRPQKGWISAIRETLGMSVSQLAKRASLDPTTVTRLEANEVRDAITLNSLKKLADALECELVYALVPKTSLKSTLEERVEALLKKEEERVEKTMSLEDQGGGKIDNSLQKALLLGKLDKRIWED